MTKIKPVLIGIDPGKSGGCIAVLDNGELIFHKMPESFKDIKTILKKYAGIPGDKEIRCSVEQLGLRPNQNPHMNARMEPMRINYNRIKDALIDCDIAYKEVAPRTWQNFGPFNMKVDGEKGIDYAELAKLKRQLKHIDAEFPNLTKKGRADLVKSYEKDIGKIKAKEKQIRKKRYQAKAQELSGDPKMPLWKADAFLILAHLKMSL